MLWKMSNSGHIDDNSRYYYCILLLVVCSCSIKGKNSFYCSSICKREAEAVNIVLVLF